MSADKLFSYGQGSSNLDHSFTVFLFSRWNGVFVGKQARETLLVSYVVRELVSLVRFG